MMSFTLFFFFSSRRRHTRCSRDWSSDVCSSDLFVNLGGCSIRLSSRGRFTFNDDFTDIATVSSGGQVVIEVDYGDRKSTRLNSSHGYISYAVFCLKKKKKLNRHHVT